MRRAARNQSLPPEEAEYLRSLSGHPLRVRCRRLFQVGWTFSAIGAPLNKSRSTIRFWVLNAPDVISTRNDDPEIPIPEDRTYIPKKPANPGISPADKDRLAHLAPLARRYRARMASTHASSQANRELTELATTLHNQNVPIQEIADAAGVTYRAMYRRIHQNNVR